MGKQNTSASCVLPSNIFQIQLLLKAYGTHCQFSVPVGTSLLSHGLPPISSILTSRRQVHEKRNITPIFGPGRPSWAVLEPSLPLAALLRSSWNTEITKFYRPVRKTEICLACVHFPVTSLLAVFRIRKIRFFNLSDPHPDPLVQVRIPNRIRIFPFSHKSVEIMVAK
jgi:hypothetical protein